MLKEADLLKSFVDVSGTVCYLKDEEGCFIMVNEVFEKMFNVSKEEAIGKSDFDFSSKEEAERWRSLDEQVRKTGMPLNTKATVSTPKGEITVLDHKFPVNDIEGHPNAVGGIAIILE